MVGLGLEGLFSLSDSGSVDELKAVLLRLVSHKRRVATGAARGAASLSRPWSGVRRGAGKAQAHPRFFRAPAEGGERGWSRLGGPCRAVQCRPGPVQCRPGPAEVSAAPGRACPSAQPRGPARFCSLSLCASGNSHVRKGHSLPCLCRHRRSSCGYLGEQGAFSSSAAAGREI